MNFHSGLAAALAPLTLGRPIRWYYVRPRFQALLENLKITEEQAKDGEVKHQGIVSCLNRAYWNSRDDAIHRILIGSWGKFTRVRPPRDVDILFVLPVEVYWRFQQRTGNRQSQLLQEVKSRLQTTYPQTDIRGDGQVVVVPFNTCKVEVAPAFPCQEGGYLVCDAHDDGRYKLVQPEAEIAALHVADTALNGNVRKLTRILKQWQRHCNVHIKSFQIEALIMELLPRLRYGRADEFWFDWLVRDAFGHMISRANGWFAMPATGEVIQLGDEWLSQASSAYGRALRACVYEDGNWQTLAGDEWQKIFGTMIPTTIG